MNSNSENILADIKNLLNLNGDAPLTHLDKIKKENQAVNELIEELSDTEKLEERVAEFRDIERMRFQKVERLNDELKSLSNSNRKTNKTKRFIIAASSVAAVIFALLIYLYDSRNSTNDSDLSTQSNIIKPTFIINESKIALNRDDVNVKKILADIKVDSKVKTENKRYDKKLIVPYRSKHTIELSDGSKVTVGSNSELIIASDFGATNRIVTLKGEAYFEVIKSDKPFIVVANGAFTKVLGTSFNVRARESGVMETVLVEGLVGIGVMNSSYKTSVTITPNVLAIAKDGKIKAEFVKVDEYLMWMGDYFHFKNAPFSKVITMFNEWYGVDIKYDEADFKDTKINLSIRKDKELNEAMTFMKKIININFSVSQEGVYRVERDNGGR